MRSKYRGAQMNEPMTAWRQRAPKGSRRRRTAADLSDADERAELIGALALAGRVGGDPADGRDAAGLCSDHDAARSARSRGRDVQEDGKIARSQVALDGAQNDV